MAAIKVIPHHLRPRIKRAHGYIINGKEKPMWECALGDTSAVADTPILAYRLFVWGYDGFITTHRARDLGLM